MHVIHLFEFRFCVDRCALSYCALELYIFLFGIQSIEFWHSTSYPHAYIARITRRKSHRETATTATSSSSSSSRQQQQCAPWMCVAAIWWINSVFVDVQQAILGLGLSLNFPDEHYICCFRTERFGLLISCVVSCALTALVSCFESRVRESTRFRDW